MAIYSEVHRAGGALIAVSPAMNPLYAKIVGPRVHLNPLVVAVALMFWSMLWARPG